MKTRTNIFVYANLATVTQAEEQCRSLGGRLPAGSQEAECLEEAVGTVGAHANEIRPWLLRLFDNPVREGDRYTLHRADAPPNEQARNTVACAFSLSKVKQRQS